MSKYIRWHLSTACTNDWVENHSLSEIRAMKERAPDHPILALEILSSRSPGRRNFTKNCKYNFNLFHAEATTLASFDCWAATSSLTKWTHQRLKMQALSQAANTWWPSIHDAAQFTLKALLMTQERPRVAKQSPWDALADPNGRKERPPPYDHDLNAF